LRERGEPATRGASHPPSRDFGAAGRDAATAPQLLAGETRELYGATRYFALSRAMLTGPAYDSAMDASTAFR
jgi:hypothetical protein